MRLIRPEAVLRWSSFKVSRTLSAEEWVEYNPDRPSGSVIFVSHRWESLNHPDPRGAQLLELQTRLRAITWPVDLLLFYDYCSIPQEPRTPDEDRMFERDLRALRTLCGGADTIVMILSEGYADYKNRAWCFFELVASHRNVQIFEDQRRMASDLEFLSTLGAEPSDADFQITSFSMRYKVDHLEVEAVLAAFQHFSYCRVTRPKDLPLINAELARHFNARSMTPFGRLVTAIAKFFQISLALGSSRGVIPCKPYFDEPSWVRLPGDSRTVTPLSGRFEDLTRHRKYKRRVDSPSRRRRCRSSRRASRHCFV